MAAGTSHTTISIKLNEQGFHDIFNKYYVTLCLFANQYTENQETSADIVQDSFAKLWQIREDFFYLHQVKAFLYTAVRNKALNELEHSKVVYEYAEGGNLAASKIRNLECPSYEICLIDYGCGKFNRKIHIMEQYP